MKHESPMTRLEALILFVAGLVVGGMLMLVGEALAGTTQQAGTNAGKTISRTRLATGVSTNTTSSISVLPPGVKTYRGKLLCTTGTCAQVLTLYGDDDDDAANGTVLCTMTLSASLVDSAVCVGQADYPYYYVTSTGTTGTGPLGVLDATY